ncbi:MAG: oligosaccharide flippase family protein [Legionellales bacterium]|nr:oligosaccharide flippase family protein [Legionellales bacterium]
MPLSKIIFTLASRGMIVLSGLLISILTARFLGVNGRGDYFYIYSLVTLLTQCCMLGLQTSNTYFVVKQPELLRKLTLNSGWVSAVVGGGASLIITGIAYYLNLSSHNEFWFLILLTPLYMFYLLGISLMAGTDKINLLNLAQLLTSILTILAVFIAGYYTHNIEITFTLIAAAWMIVSLLVFFSLYTPYTSEPILSLKFHHDIFLTGFTYSLKAYLISVCMLIVLRFNVLMLKEFSSFAEVGYYSIAAQLTDALGLLPATVGLLLFPHLLRYQINDLSIITQVLLRMAILIFVLIVFTWFMAPWFIHIFFGNAFLPAVQILHFMLPGAFFSSMIILLAQYLAARNLLITYLYIWIVGVIINVLLGYLLISRYNGVGAAIAMSISYFFIFCSGFLLIYMNKNSDRT